jgi:SRSO17 transposase
MKVGDPSPSRYTSCGEDAFEAGVLAAWVTGDAVYGGDRRLRMWLEEREQPVVLAVKSNEPLWSDGDGGVRQPAAATIAASLRDDDWHRLSAGAGSKGPRVYDWARGEVVRLPDPDWNHWRVIRRSIDGPTDVAYYVCFGPADTSLVELVRVAGTRWASEECIETAKGEVGLDEYEVRKWRGWYRPITLSLLAHAYLTITRATATAAGPANGGTIRRGSMAVYRQRQRASSR